MKKIILSLLLSCGTLVYAAEDGAVDMSGMMHNNDDQGYDDSMTTDVAVYDADQNVNDANQMPEQSADQDAYDALIQEAMVQNNTSFFDKVVHFVGECIEAIVNFVKNIFETITNLFSGSEDQSDVYQSQPDMEQPMMDEPVVEASGGNGRFRDISCWYSA